MLNNIYKDYIKTVQMEFWAILSNDMKYIQHYEKTAHILDIKALHYRQHRKLYNKLKGEEGQMLNMDFGDNPNTLKTNYLDMYEEIHAGMVYSNRFDESSDLQTTYLGGTNMTREPNVKTEEKSPISGQGFIMRKLLDDTDCQILLGTGVSKSYFTKVFYLQCIMLSKFASNMQRIQAGNGQNVGV